VGELCEGYLYESDVELEVDLGGGDGKSTVGIVERCAHSGGGLVEFTFEKPDATKAGEDLRIRSTIF